MKKKLRIPAIQIWACFACPWHIFICMRIKILCILVDSYINLAESVQHLKDFPWVLKVLHLGLEPKYFNYLAKKMSKMPSTK